MKKEPPYLFEVKKETKEIQHIYHNESQHLSTFIGGASYAGKFKCVA